ncbi:hypothetical protein BKA61DRAFT_616089, partial [Leptodontidium sp. MPI-SDFR-AT-0119]
MHSQVQQASVISSGRMALLYLSCIFCRLVLQLSWCLGVRVIVPARVMDGRTEAPSCNIDEEEVLNHELIPSVMNHG